MLFSLLTVFRALLPMSVAGIIIAASNDLSPVAPIIIFILSFLLIGPAEYIVAHATSVRVSGGKLGLADLISIFTDSFSSAAQAFVLGIMRTLICALFSLLLIVPGIVKSYSYALAFQIHADNPSYSWLDCLRESEQMMYGYKFDLFKNDLVMLGWKLLGLYYLGVGILFVLPYAETTRANFYYARKALKHQTIPYPSYEMKFGHYESLSRAKDIDSPPQPESVAAYIPNSQYRKNASAQLGGSIFSPLWILFSVCVLISSLLTARVSYSFDESINEDIQNIESFDDVLFVAEEIVEYIKLAGTLDHMIMLFAVITAITSLILSGIMMLGLARISLRRACNYSGIDVKELFYGFTSMKRFRSAVALGIMNTLYTVFWGMMVIPVIPKIYSYSMAFYFRHDFPELSWKECLDHSTLMMDGCRVKLFLLDLSTALWLLPTIIVPFVFIILIPSPVFALIGLGLLLLGGVSLLVALPYLYMARANFYLARRAEMYPEADE